MRMSVLMKNRLFYFALVALFMSCNKEDAFDDSPYFTISSLKNGEFIVDSDCSFPKNYPWELTNSFGKVSFSSLSFVVEDSGGDSHYIGDDSMTVFYFGFEISPKWAWSIDSPFIEDGKKYYCDTSLLAKHNYCHSTSFTVSSPKSLFMVYSPHYPPVTYGPKVEKVIWGWMSFTKKVDDPGIILRVDFEADVVVTPGLAEKEDTIRYRKGRIDFTTKMANKIIGGERLK